MNPSTGEISGTPSVSVVPAQRYTVTATDEATGATGRASASVTRTLSSGSSSSSAISIGSAVRMPWPKLGGSCLYVKNCTRVQPVCVNDVKNLKSALIDHCGFAQSDIRTLTDLDATTKAIQPNVAA